MKANLIETQKVTSWERPTAPRLRLHYLDGLRGLAALYVVLYHCYMQVWSTAFLTSLSAIPRFVVCLLSFGHLSVDVFIVLSGYCLMLPVARSADGQISGSVFRFFKRRAVRILPPYYAALLVSLLLIWCVPALKYRTGANWDIALPALRPDVIASHLFLVHNLSSEWRFKIDIPMWSVATEWQIYFLFPLLLLPALRRFGIIGLLVASFVFWMAIHIFFHARFDGAALHFTSLFSFGMVGAILGFSREAQKRAWHKHIPWGICTLASSLVLAIILGWRPGLIEKHTSHIDLLAGICAMCLLIYCTQHLSGSTSRRPWILNLLESHTAVRVGQFSYSLYLIHAPVLALCYAFLRTHHCQPVITLVLVIALGVPLSLLLSYLFYLGFERPFLRKRDNRKATPAEQINPDLIPSVIP